jgi:hypothetical protein
LRALDGGRDHAGATLRRDDRDAATLPEVLVDA